MAVPCLLVGDIGGTNARFALANAENPGFSHEKTYQCADFASANQAIGAYLKDNNANNPKAICIAAAGPIVDGVVRFTNNSWRIETKDLRNEFDTPGVKLLNDFEAIAYSVPWLQQSDILSVGLPEPKNLKGTDFTLGVLGPGTGLGAAGLCKRGDQISPIVGEAGHLGFAPETQVQVELLSQLRERFDRVSDERLVSGPGMENIYWALSKIRGEKNAQLSAAEIFSAASESGDSAAAESVQLFFEILGQVAGNLALSLGATDGIYIAGGVVKRNLKLIANSRFRTGFEGKGRHRSLMEKIPTQVILYSQPGLLGASYCAIEIMKGNM
jgi:glucokinase